jgi:isoleucyl-tRNA synthetase
MSDWLTNMADWCIFRKRYWGLPLPFYPCPACRRLTVVASRAELKLAAKFVRNT